MRVITKMPEIVDNTRSYESQRNKLGNMTLRERRIAMMQSRGLVESDENNILQELNGNSYTPLKKFLENTLYRSK